MAFNAGCHCEDVGVENDVGRRKLGFFREQAVGSGTYFYASLEGVCLSFFVESHDDNSRSHCFDEFGACEERLFAFFEADGIDNSFSLQAFERGFDDFPRRRVDHDGHASRCIVVGQHSEKCGHFRFRVEHGVVHVDIDDLRPCFDLPSCSGNGFSIVFFINETKEFSASGHVASFADADESRVFFACLQRVETRQDERPFLGLYLAWLMRFRDFGDGANMLRRRSATPSCDVDDVCVHQFFEKRGSHVGRFSVAACRVRQACIGIDGNGGIGQ